MADLLPQDELPDDLGPMLKRRPLRDDSDLDITPMIDITFLLLIFFMVASIPDPQNHVSRPSAIHGKTINARDAVFVTVIEGDDGSVVVYKGANKEGEPLAADHELQREALLEYFREQVAAGKSKLIFNGEKTLKMGDVIRISALAKEIGLYWAVKESKE